MMMFQQYANMTRPTMSQNEQDLPQNFEKINLDDQTNINNDKDIVDSLTYYFSIDNLNKDYFIRSRLDSEGYIDASHIINFNKMKANSVTIEKIDNILNKFNTVIETQVRDNNLYLRHKNWDTINDRLTHLSEIKQSKTKNATIQNNNYVHMQNNFYYNFSPQMMLQNMDCNPYMVNQRMPSIPQMFNPYAYQQQSNIYSNQTNKDNHI